MTHPIVEGLTEAVTMAKLMRENEELHRMALEQINKKIEYYNMWQQERKLADELYYRRDNSLAAYRKARGM